MSLAPGTRLGPYEIVSQIGAGGMGEVYRARDTRLARIVAVKVSAEQFSERFEREARAIATLNHPNICTLYDVGPNYLVMEYIEGPTLHEPHLAAAGAADGLCYRRDALLIQVEALGSGVCHEGYESCFFRRLDSRNWQVSGGARLRSTVDLPRSAMRVSRPTDRFNRGRKHGWRIARIEGEPKCRHERPDLRNAIKKACHDAERKQLVAISHHRSSPRGIVLRIDIVLGAAQGLANRVLARKLSTSVPTVLLWRKWFESDGLAGIVEDRPRSGRPKRISADREAAIVQATMKTTPKDATQWSVRAMAVAQKVSSSTVQRIWKKHKLQPNRIESFKFFDD